MINTKVRVRQQIESFQCIIRDKIRVTTTAHANETRYLAEVTKPTEDQYPGEAIIISPKEIASFVKDE